MTTYTLSTRFIAIATLALVTITGAFASNTIANVSANAGGTDFTFSGGVGGTLQTTPSTGFSVASSGPLSSTNAATFILSPITETGPVTSFGGGSYLADFSGGSFQIKQGTTVLLAGTFSGAKFFNTSGTAFQLSSVGNDDITYVDPAGPYATQYLTQYGGTAPIVGDFSLSFSSVTSPGAGGGGKHVVHTVGSGSNIGLAAFSVGGFGGTFDADATSVVPESNGSLLMLAALAPLGLVGLLVSRRKRTGSHHIA